ncbi:MAG: hypothetical protein LBV51_02305 [Acholeplasmatales bacterium]|jgi:hypothetical protein|nr:hypothetical protein [Acholeplasmatales bacterium]
MKVQIIGRYEKNAMIRRCKSFKDIGVIIIPKEIFKMIRKTLKKPKYALISNTFYTDQDKILVKIAPSKDASIIIMDYIMWGLLNGNRSITEDVNLDRDIFLLEILSYFDEDVKMLEFQNNKDLGAVLEKYGKRYYDRALQYKEKGNISYYEDDLKQSILYKYQKAILLEKNNGVEINNEILWKKIKVNIQSYDNYVVLKHNDGGTFGFKPMKKPRTMEEFQSMIKDEDDDAEKRRDKSLFKNLTNIYESTYSCPYCNEQLWKTVFPINKEYEIYTNDVENKHVGIKRLFTCQKCFKLFTSENILTDEWIYECNIGNKDEYWNIIADINSKGQTHGRPDGGFIKLKNN